MQKNIKMLFFCVLRPLSLQKSCFDTLFFDADNNNLKPENHAVESYLLYLKTAISIRNRIFRFQKV